MLPKHVIKFIFYPPTLCASPSTFLWCRVKLAGLGRLAHVGRGVAEWEGAHDKNTKLTWCAKDCKVWSKTERFPQFDRHIVT